MESLFIHLIKKMTFMTGFVVQGQYIYIDVYGCKSSCILFEMFCV